VIDAVGAGDKVPSGRIATNFDRHQNGDTQIAHVADQLELDWMMRALAHKVRLRDDPRDVSQTEGEIVWMPLIRMLLRPSGETGIRRL
jgi:hypothetical protein